MAGFAVTLEEPANIPGQNSGCGKSEQFLDAAFHREVLKCFTVTRQKATTVAQTVAETSAPDPTRWRFSKPPPNRILLTDAKTLEFSANICLTRLLQFNESTDWFASLRHLC
jgi:hypothetical protein